MRASLIPLSSIVVGAALLFGACAWSSTTDDRPATGTDAAGAGIADSFRVAVAIAARVVDVRTSD